MAHRAAASRGQPDRIRGGVLALCRQFGISAELASVALALFTDLANQLKKRPCLGHANKSMNKDR